jgi:hypothetical protein
MKQSPSVVYLAGQSDGQGPVKIGYTTLGVHRRLSVLRAAGNSKYTTTRFPSSVDPSKIVVYAEVPGGRELETDLKGEWLWCRVLGEWFDLPDRVSTFEQEVQQLTDAPITIFRR